MAARKTAAPKKTSDPNDNQPGPWLTLAEASERLRYKSRFGIYSWLKQNPDVQKVRRGKKQWLVAKRDVDAALRQQGLAE